MTPSFISEKIVASSVLPIVMIPACTLLSMIFNNRLIAILSFLRKRQDNMLNLKYESIKNKQSQKSDLDKFYYQQDELWNKHLYQANDKRAQLLRWGIIFEYSAIFTFSTAAICILLSFFSSILIFISGTLLIIGTALVIVGLTFGFRELLMALRKLGESSRLMEEISEDLLEKFEQS